MLPVLRIPTQHPLTCRVRVQFIEKRLGFTMMLGDACPRGASRCEQWRE